MYMWKVRIGRYWYIVTGPQIRERAEALAVRMHEKRFSLGPMTKATESIELEQIDFKTAVWIDKK